MPADDALRDRLVRVGAELLRTGSPEALSLREIARRAGVSHGAPRRYFPTHLSLLSAIARSGYADLSAQVTAALLAASPDPREQIATIAHLYVRFAATNRGMFELMFRHDLLQSGYLGLRDDALPLFRLLVDQVAAARPASGPLAAPPAETTAAAIWSALHGVAELWNWGSLTLATRATDPAPFIDAVLDAHLGPPAH
ncbi:TetR/AcrR family transcriptional regulator [Actinoplanes teichomyceticus]|uniref:TetR family transcriptional regulator n=1 Tax=Actinoplanes teichomyceticus TaxID=1867 RepID=A0A561VRC2_ACTTI|nr:TetR/AcrR family transcriptional regulator [Actinoplanes teichomyceticus]TWG14140.1 TetR family transcriptional regulator [Actinoplanes teichomyceticus]GIF13300.1 TetR family transcriptional regulator [Actinoplanes teichomyceticus]